MGPHPHCQHLADQRRPSLYPSSRHLSVAISFCFKLTWVVISAGYPVSKELYSLQLFSACRALWEAVKICKSRCLSVLSWGIFFFSLPLSKSKRECLSLALNTRGERKSDSGSATASSLQDRSPQWGWMLALRKYCGNQWKQGTTTNQESLHILGNLTSSCLCLPSVLLENEILPQTESCSSDL